MDHSIGPISQTLLEYTDIYQNNIPKKMPPTKEMTSLSLINLKYFQKTPPCL